MSDEDEAFSLSLTHTEKGMRTGNVDISWLADAVCRFSKIVLHQCGLVLGSFFQKLFLILCTLLLPSVLSLHGLQGASSQLHFL